MDLNQRIQEARLRAAASTAANAGAPNAGVPESPPDVHASADSDPPRKGDQPKASLGFVLAREWLYFNYFLWGGVVVATVGSFLYAPAKWERREFWEMASILFPLMTAGPYIAFTYVRSLRKAWRISAGKESPPAVTDEDLKKLTEILPKAGNNDA